MVARADFYLQILMTSVATKDTERWQDMAIYH